MASNDRWCGWWNLQCSAPIVPLAAAIVVAETVAAWAGIAVWHPIGGVAVTPVLLAAALLATLVGWRRLGFSGPQMRAWAECAACIALMLLGVVALFLARGGSLRALMSFVAGATEEELVFRLAAPIAAGGLAAWLARRPAGDLSRWGTLPRVVALVVAAASFTFGPGHVSEIGSTAWRAVPFVAVALLLSYVVLRTGNLVAGLLVHTLLNLTTTCYLTGGISRDAWALVVILGLGGFALGAERAGQRLGLMVPAAASV